MPWIFNEDEALKAKLQGLRVPATNAAQGLLVRAYFRLPESELRDIAYPCIIIDHASILRDSSREHRGRIRLPYAPEGSALWDDPNLAGGSLDPTLSPYISDYPVPYNIDYIVTLQSRKAQQHFALVAALAEVDRLPARFGYLEIPQDGTVRNLEVIGGPSLSADEDDKDKSLFSATYRVRVATELAASEIRVFSKVSEVDYTIADNQTRALMDSFRITYDP